MNLENVTAELRPRSEWEAADFGVRMVRRDAAAIYRVWFAITLPLLFLAVLAIVFTPYATLAMFLYWWLEPLADGPILRLISRRLFGEKADVAAALRATFSLAWQNRIFLLTPYRFHLARSIATPLTQLEGLKGTARRTRAKVLNVKIMNHGIGVTIAYQHLALALYIGIILIGFALVPAQYQDTLGEDWIDQFLFNSTKLASVLSLLVMYIAQSALQPWFVGAGFGLYINCRTLLEAWDIEIAFRRMIQRRVANVAVALVAAVLAAPVVLYPTHTWSQESSDTDYEDAEAGDPGIHGYWNEDAVRPAVDAIFKREALRTEREVEDWQAIERPDRKVRAEDDGAGAFAAAIRQIGKVVALIVEFGLWIAVGLLLLLIFTTRKRWLPYLQAPQEAGTRTRRVMLAGGEVTAETIPDDVPTVVMGLWRAGEKRQALALLYRASVFAAVTRHGVRLPSSATEGECVRAVEKQSSHEQSDYFGQVVSAWVHCAYGFREPDDGTIRPLCEEWNRHYGGAT